jgi:hypothetical protein
MELLDRYLKAIRSYLPAGQKDDIIRELSEDIRSRMEEKESELGRPLNEAEIEAILKSYGHPLLVAGRYRQDDRTVAFGKQLIGPVLFPFYTKVLSFNLGITSAVLIFVFAVLIASGQPLSLLKDLPTVFFYQLLIQFVIVTAIFTGVDRHLAKHPDRWDPRKPNRPYYANVVTVELNEPGTVSRIESVSKLIGLLVLIVWLRVLQQAPFLVLGPLAAILRFAPVWHQVYVPLLLVIFLGMAQAAINLVWPAWVNLRSATKVVSRAAVLAICVFLFKSGPWIVSPETAAALAAEHSHTLEIVNQCFYYALLAAVILSAGQLLVDSYRLVRGTPHRAPSGALPLRGK